MRLRILSDDNDNPKLITLFADKPDDNIFLKKVIETITTLIDGEKDGPSTSLIHDGHQD